MVDGGSSQIVPTPYLLAILLLALVDPRLGQNRTFSGGGSAASNKSDASGELLKHVIISS